jgi:membrane glycosyltransferase
MPTVSAHLHREALRRRLLLGVMTFFFMAIGLVPMARSLLQGGATVYKVAFLLVNFLLLSRVAFGFSVALLGWWLARFQAPNSFRINTLPPDAAIPNLPATAVVMPIYNEEVSRVFQGLRLMYESLQKTGHGAAFDFFVLSDTNDLNGCVEEEKAWFELCKDVQGFGRIFYRKRRVARHHKSGNIADFCRRWGAGYRYMIVLDADSLVTGDLLIRLTALMEGNPGVGIIQTTPRAILGRSLFQRIEQFAAYVYRPILSLGENFWQLDRATFWGHNAIVRLKPFIEFCAVPELPEVGPLGRRILSHDTIEAALMQREGYAVWQAYDLAGSYEEGPPNLLTSLQRDRRWCHGNLQHTWFLFERGLRPTSRFNIFLGILSYLGAPLWLFSILLGVVIAHEGGGAPTAPAGGAIIPALLFAYVMTLLLLPKALAVSVLFAQPEKLAGVGGRSKLLLGVGAEIIYSTLLAPILMLYYTRFVLAVFTGHNAGWGHQVRSDDKGPRWIDWIATHWSITLIGVAAAVIVAWLAPAALIWFIPVLAGPILSIPLSRFTASNSIGIEAQKNGWFLIPEEMNLPADFHGIEEPLLAPAMPFFRGEEYARDYGLLQAILDPYVNAIHVSLLRQRKEPSIRTREYMAYLSAHLLLEGPQSLSEAEKRTLFWEPDSMLAMHQKLWGSPASHLHNWWQVAFRRYNENAARTARRTVNA